MEAMEAIRREVFNKHASPNTIMHCMYGYYYQGVSKHQLARIYGKSVRTISNWITRYEADGCFSRKLREQVYIKFPADQREWIVQQYLKRPTLYLDEAKELFQNHFRVSISLSSIFQILHASGFSWKTVQRRAIQLRDADIVNFYFELGAINWQIHNLVFLDEVSFDSRDVLRNKGFGPVGKRIVFRGEFIRKPRISLLCFLGQHGLLESFITDGTFTRQKFFDCCRSFALSGKVQKFPGYYSVWVLDGAKIHCHRSIVEYLRSVGIHVIFLPAYAPFFNPIEYMFGYVKQYLQRNYVENSTEEFSVAISNGLEHYKQYDFSKVFRKCGYRPGGYFDPSVGLNNNSTR